MRRFHVFALVAVVSLAGGLGLAFGQSSHPQPGSKSQATKTRPPAPPGKRPPSKVPPQVKKSPSQAHRTPAKGSKSPHQAQKGQAKHGAGSYSFDDYKRDLGKAAQKKWHGFLTELPTDAKIVGGAIATGGPGAIGGAISGAPDLLRGKYEEWQADREATSATERFIGSWFNGMFNSNRPPTKSKNDAQKSNQRPAKSR